MREDARRGLLFIAITAAVALIAGWLLSRLHVDADVTFREEAAALRQETTPPGGQAEALSACERRAYGARVTWTVASPQTWPDYCNWLQSRLVGYRLSEQTDAQATFTKDLQGDALHLIVERISAGTPVKARII